jgi:hypothetical protein
MQTRKPLSALRVGDLATIFNSDDEPVEIVMVTKAGLGIIETDSHRWNISTGKAWRSALDTHCNDCVLKSYQDGDLQEIVGLQAEADAANHRSMAGTSERRNIMSVHPIPRVYRNHRQSELVPTSTLQLFHAMRRFLSGLQAHPYAKQYQVEELLKHVDLEIEQREPREMLTCGDCEEDNGSF